MAGLASSAHAESLWEAELRLGYGISVGGGEGMPSTRGSPLTFSGTASVAFNEDPLLYGYGGILIETLDRSSVGAVAGVRVLVGKVRLAGGGVRIFKPYTLWGGVVSAGTCKRLSANMQGCGSAEVTAYFAGDDLPSGHTVMQAQLVMSMVFDAP